MPPQSNPCFRLGIRALIAATASLLLLGAASAPNVIRPNIVMIVVDDMRIDEFGAGGHPYLKTPNIDAIAANGAMFTNAYHVTPLCSPNRASLLTGQYVSRHGIFDNTSRANASHRLDLFAKDLQQAGYRTAHVGKWHMGNDPTPRPGYDYWLSFAGQGKTYDPDLYEDGRIHNVKGYITDIFTDRADGFIRRNAGGEQPFFVYIGHKAVHPESKQRNDGSVDLSVNRSFIPANRHKGQYEGETVTRRPNYGAQEQDLAGKPVIAEALAIRAQLMADDENWAREVDPGIAENTIRRRAEMMLAVDEGVGKLIATLKDTGEYENTLFIFTSDNGYFYGEHDLTIERRLPYEEALKTPLVMQYPARVKAGQVINGLVQSIDYAATALDLAGVEAPSRVQGKSLMPLLTGGADEIRDVGYMEFYAHENPFIWTAKLDYRIVRRGDFKYIRWIRYEDGKELYNLKDDPFEQNNLVGDPRYANVLAELQAELKVQILDAMGLSDE